MGKIFVALLLTFFIVPEEYFGGHAEHLEGTDGRTYTAILPFFDTYLNF